MTKSEAQDLLRKHGTKTKAADAVGVGRGVITRALAQGSDGEKPAAKKGRSLAEFRALYDKDYIVPRKVKAALKELSDGWEYEVQFAKDAGVSLADLSAYREQFADHVVQIGRESRRVWAGTVGLARELRESI